MLQTFCPETWIPFSVAQRLSGLLEVCTEKYKVILRNEPQDSMIVYGNQICDDEETTAIFNSTFHRGLLCFGFNYQV